VIPSRSVPTLIAEEVVVLTDVMVVVDIVVVGDTVLAVTFSP
jgi:hypothetical protein